MGMDMNEPAVVVTDREDGDVSIKTPARSLRTASVG